MNATASASMPRPGDGRRVHADVDGGQPLPGGQRGRLVGQRQREPGQQELDVVARRGGRRSTHRGGRGLHGARLPAIRRQSPRLVGTSRAVIHEHVRCWATSERVTR